jgi:antitoxin component of MazEF toxin-antitoxin module
MYSVDMKRKLVRIGGSLAVILPSEVVREFGLKEGRTVEVSVHPQTGAITIRPGVRVFEGGKATKRFDRLASGLLKRRARLYRELAK